MENKQDDSRPPLFKSWKGWYWLLVGNLALLVLLFYLFTRHYS